MHMLSFDNTVVQKELDRILAIARATGMSLKDAADFVTEKLVDCGMQYGFMPTDLALAPGLSGATVEIMYCDYKTDATITV